MYFFEATRNDRPPPSTRAKTQSDQVDSWCRYDPAVCVWQIAVEAVFVAAAYGAVLFLTGGTVPSPFNVAKFLALFVALSMAARMISDDLGNKLSIAAVSGIGSKCVSILAPRFVTW